MKWHRVWTNVDIIRRCARSRRSRRGPGSSTRRSSCSGARGTAPRASRQSRARPGSCPRPIYATFGSKRGIIDGLVRARRPATGPRRSSTAGWNARAGDPVGPARGRRRASRPSSGAAMTRSRWSSAAGRATPTSVDEWAKPPERSARLLPAPPVGLAGNGLPGGRRSRPRGRHPVGPQHRRGLPPLRPRTWLGAGRLRGRGCSPLLRHEILTCAT